MGYRKLIFFGIIGLLTACSTEKNSDSFFTSLTPKETGINFVNQITENESINVIDFQYCYNGGGVGIGDFNADGLPDIVFTGNQVSSQLYLNQGNLKFKNVSKEVDFTTNKWATGVSIIDINADGLDDIYINVGGAQCATGCTNLLFVNQGNQKPNNLPFFKEMSEEYGLNVEGYAQQTVFFDYDLDDDLDAFVLRNGNVAFDKNSPMPKRYYPEHLTDKLLENNFDVAKGHATFKDVSEERGINKKGFGLGVALNDFNQDGRPDIFVGNDFITDDLLYLNTHSTDTTTLFVEQGKRFFKHNTYNAMGVDMGDVNGDGLDDLLVLDMLPKAYNRQKKMLGAMNYDKYLLALRNDFTPQFMRNTLHLQQQQQVNAYRPWSEVGFLAGIAKTDWSWSPLLADFDADGDKDIYITNGYGKDITDLDFINYTKQNNVFGTEQTRNKTLTKLIGKLPSVHLDNVLYTNQGNLDFKEVTGQIKNQTASLSNGAAYADFDGDGDLDIVVNNINEPAFFLENHASDKDDFNYIQIQLKGSKNNKNAIGASVRLWQNGKEQHYYQSTVRGYLSSVDPLVYFGLRDSLVDSIAVQWPNGNKSFLSNIVANKRITITQYVPGKKNNQSNKEIKPLLQKDSLSLAIQHSAEIKHDYALQALLLQQPSKRSPVLAVDKSKKILFIAGDAKRKHQLVAYDDSLTILQELNLPVNVTAASFVDIDKDGTPELYLGTETGKKDIILKKYANKGYKIEQYIEALEGDTRVVKPYDYDNDGDMDVFVGMHQIKGSYPQHGKSLLLENTTNGFNKHMLNLGLVNDATWVDVDNDGLKELVAVGEWMPITVIKYQQGKLNIIPQVFMAKAQDTHTEGLWRSIMSLDVDLDGDLDFILGNQGLNNFLNPTPEAPMYIYNKDFDANGSIDPIIGAYHLIDGKNKLMPLHTRDDVMKQVVSLKADYNSYDDFAKVDFKKLLKIKSLEKETKKIHLAYSALAINDGRGNFELKPLPKACQVAPINAITSLDVNADGKDEIFLVGNDYSTETHYGRHDAFNGALLQADAYSNVTFLPTEETGFLVPKQANYCVIIKTATGDKKIVVSQFNNTIQTYSLNK